MYMSILQYLCIWVESVLEKERNLQPKEETKKVVFTVPRYYHK